MKPAQVAVLSENQFEIIKILEELKGKCPGYGDTKNSCKTCLQVPEVGRQV